MKQEYEDYLKDILDAIRKARQFVQNYSYEDFDQDDKTVFATIRALEIIGEATKKIPGNVRKNNPQIPWKDMAGMRDVLIHDYFGIDLETVWFTVTQKLPQIELLIKKLLEQK